MIPIGIAIALGVSIVCALFLWAACFAGARGDDRCESAWEEDPYLSEEVRASLHPFDAEVMPVGDAPNQAPAAQAPARGRVG